MGGYVASAVQAASDLSMTALPADYSGASEDPLAQPVEGWVALAELVSDTAESLADLMVAVSDVARALVEERIPGLVESMAARFDLPRDAYEGIAAAFRATAIPLNTENALHKLALSYSLLQGDRSDLAALIESSDNGLADAVMSEFRGTERLANIDDYYQRSRDVLDQFRRGPDVPLEASCSLEQPSLLGAYPLYCARLAHPTMKDRISAAEYTYGTAITSSFDENIRQEGAVVGGYRHDIDYPRVEYFWSTVTQGVMSRTYAIHVNEGPRFRFRGMKSAQEVLIAHRDDIAAAAQNAVNSSRDQIEERAPAVLESVMGAGAAAAAVPFVHTLIPLVAAVAGAVVKFIVGRVAKALNGGDLTTWTVGHTIVTGSEWVPLSVFTLSHSGPPALCRLTFDSAGKPQASDYDVYPDEYRRSRFMLGVTNDSSAHFDTGYFDVVAKRGRPLAWSDPSENNSGFRILLPHTRPGSGAVYVTAIRADVRPG
jgi:hypothetical protein